MYLLCRSKNRATPSLSSSWGWVSPSGSSLVLPAARSEAARIAWHVSLTGADSVPSGEASLLSTAVVRSPAEAPRRRRGCQSPGSARTTPKLICSHDKPKTQVIPGLSRTFFVNCVAAHCVIPTSTTTIAFHHIGGRTAEAVIRELSNLPVHHSKVERSLGGKIKD